MSRSLFIIVITFIMAALSPAAIGATTTASAPAPDAPVILIVGDSLSAAYGIAREQGWPALLAQRLHAGHFPHAVVNVSITGETTRGGLSRLAAALGQHRPAIVIVELGANDGLRGLSLEQMRDNLRSMIRQSRQARARVLLIGMKLPPNYGPEYGRKFSEVYAELAREEKIALVPFLFDGFADRREAFIDGLHPTAQMQPVLLDTIWPALRPLLRKP